MRKPSPAMIVAVVALLSSLTGGAVAATVITGKNVKNSSLTGADVKNSTLTGKDVKNGSLSSADLKKGGIAADRLTAAARASLKGAAGPAGATGPAGGVGPAGPQGPAGTPDGYTKGEADARFAARQGALVYSERAGGLFADSDDDANLDVNARRFTSFFATDFGQASSPNGGYTLWSTAGASNATPRELAFIGLVSPPAIAPTGARLLAFHLCYRATPVARLKTIGLLRYRPSDIDASGLQTESDLFTDTTIRSDTACRRYPITGDQEMRPGDTYRVSGLIEARANGAGVGSRLAIYSTGVEYQPG